MIIHLDATLPIEVILFLVYLAILHRIFYRPMAKIFQQRAAQVEAGLRAADESQRRAEEAQDTVRQQLDEARAQAQASIAAVAKAAEAQRQERLAQARQAAEALVRSAQDDIQREREAALVELRRVAGQFAILTAVKVAGQRLDTAANRDLAERAIAEAGAARGSAGRDAGDGAVATIG